MCQAGQPSSCRQHLALYRRRGAGGWARGPPALLTVQSGGTEQGPSTATGLWEVLVVGLQCVSTGGTTHQSPASPSPPWQAGPRALSLGWGGRGWREGAGESQTSAQERRLASKVRWLGGEEAGIGVWAQVTHPFWVPSYEGDDSKVASETPPSSALRCEGDSPR